MDRKAFSPDLDLPPDLLQEALTHPSYKHIDPDTVHYERFETLGDAVLGLLVMEDLVATDASLDPGKLTMRRSSLVKNRTLSQIADQLHITPSIITAPGYRLTSRDRANVIEALFGALFTHGGYEVAREWYSVLRPMLYELSGDVANPIGELQEYTQSKRIKLPTYAFSKSGPDHNPEFQATVSIDINGTPFSASGKGGSKQHSREEAAAELLRILLNQKDS